MFLHAITYLHGSTAYLTHSCPSFANLKYPTVRSRFSHLGGSPYSILAGNCARMEYPWSVRELALINERTYSHSWLRRSEPTSKARSLTLQEVFSERSTTCFSKSQVIRIMPFLLS